MKKFLLNSFNVLQKISFLLLIVCSCWMFSGFDTPDQPKPSVQVVKCYPNPATSFVNFEFSKVIDKTNSLLVFSFVGKKMAEIPVNNNKLTITLNDYYRGVYVFQLRDKGGNIIECGKFSVVK